MTLLLFSELGGTDEPDPDDDAEEDDLLGGADDGLIGDDLGFEDDGDDGSDDDELTYRLDEIDKEVDSLENQVETVRGENEQISDSITTVEKNVDKLVEMYEIVTQGVNPFVGDQELGNAFETAAGQGGVFGGEDDPADDIDDDIMDSEAEDFLDDDLGDDGDVGDEFGELDAEAEEDEADTDELDDLDIESEDTTADDAADEFSAELDELGDEASELESDGTDVDDGSDDAGGADGDDEASTAPVGTNGEIGDPPYLVHHPARNDAELATLEWLQFLVDAAGLSGAARTIAYYESVGWISEPVGAYLHSLLSGFGDETAEPGPRQEVEPRSVLRKAEHQRSLQYIARIATPSKTPEPADSWDHRSQ